MPIFEDIGQKYIAAVEQIKNIEKNLRYEINDLQELKKDILPL